MKCFLCQKSSFEEKYVLPTKRILKCKNDGLHLAQQTKKEKIYGNSYFSNSPNALSQSYYRSKLETLKLATRKRFPKILDIGCGWGDFLEVLQEEKIPYLGIDINKEAVHICKKKRLNCKLSSIQQLNNAAMKQFDAITMFQVIEHLKNPFPVLQSAKKLLKKNAVLFITTPNNDSPLRKLFGAKWSVYNESSHHVFYNKYTLQKLLRLAGFKKARVKIDSMRFLSSNYILQRFFSMYFHWKLEIGNRKFSFPIPTDPLGDIQSTAYTEDVYPSYADLQSKGLSKQS